MNQRMTLKAVASISVVTCGRASCAICNLISCSSPLRNVFCGSTPVDTTLYDGPFGKKRPNEREEGKGKG
jgi:hypothetical protein